ncbi:hypothetical protein WUBG_08384 [Wuchereria bancrofti]|uniref:Uncharacterized protein n=1 Tax=Wuchereria bancrofti TaxID=6293 RepID=J9EUA6_WUCBA|nr:hypothetical protein WUBG_08384 [Wuchereria bancrofti]VDM07499.1 unnamed protein product [Wuchereria bancrofti]
MVFRGIARGTFLLLIAINLLTTSLVDAVPYGYARPSSLKGNGAEKPYDGGPGPSDDVGYYQSVKNGQDESSKYYGGKKDMMLPQPRPPPSRGYEANSKRGQMSYARPSYNS